MTPNEHAEISASVAAHAELGPKYDSAVAEGLVERIGEEIDRRVDARLGAGGQTAPPAAARAPAAMPPAYPPPGYAPPVFPGSAAAPAPPAAQRRSNGLTGMVLGLGSIGIATGATTSVVSHHANSFAQVLMVLLIWAAVALVNIAHARRG